MTSEIGRKDFDDLAGIRDHLPESQHASVFCPWFAEDDGSLQLAIHLHLLVSKAAGAVGIGDHADPGVVFQPRDLCAVLYGGTWRKGSDFEYAHGRSDERCERWRA